MRGVVKVPAFSGLYLLFLLLTGLPSHGAAPQLEFVGQWPAETRGIYEGAVAADGLLTVAASSGGVQIFNLRVPDAPARAGELYELPQEVMAIARDGACTLAVGFRGWLASLDLGDPTAPTVLWQTNRESRFNLSVAIAGSLGVVQGSHQALPGSFIEVWDLEDASLPRLRSTVAITNGHATGNVVFDGTNAFFSAYPLGLVRIDIGQPETPVVSVTLTNIPGDNLSRSGSRMLAVGRGRPTLLDISNPAGPVPLNTNLLDEPFGRYGLLAGDRAYIAGSTNLWILDVASPANPVLLGSAPLRGYVSALELAASNLLAIVTMADGIQLLDVADPEQPRLVGTVGSHGHALRVEPNGHAAYVADGYTLRVLDVSSPSAPQSVAVETGIRGGSVLDVALSGTNLVAGGSPRELEMLTTAAPLAPALVTRKSLSLADGIASLWWLDAGQLVLGYSRGLYGLGVLDITRLGSPVAVTDIRLDRLSPPSVMIGRGGRDGYGLAVSGTNLYVLAPTNGPPNLIQAGRLALNAVPLAAAGPDAFGIGYVAAGTNGLLVVDAGRPLQPRLISSHTTRGPARGVTLHGSYVFVAEGFDGVEVFDATNPTNLLPVAHFDTRGEAMSVSLEGNRVYVADGARGVTILRWDAGPARRAQAITFGPLLTRVTNSAPFAITATASSGLPVAVRIVNGPLIESDGLFRTTGAYLWGQSVTNSLLVRLRFLVAGNDEFEPAYLDAVFDVVRRPSDHCERWLLEAYPDLRAVQMHRKADPDGDGALNEIEYAFLTNPTLAGALDGRLPAPRIEWDGQRWVARIEVAVNPNLAAGTTAAFAEQPPAWSLSPAPYFRRTGNRITITFPLNDPKAGSRFVQLRFPFF